MNEPPNPTTEAEEAEHEYMLASKALEAARERFDNARLWWDDVTKKEARNGK